MWPDPRIGDHANRTRTRGLLDQWAALEQAERQALADRPAPAISDFNERELWDYARAVEEVHRIVSEDFEWSQLDIEAAERNAKFHLALITADGVQRPRLVSAAKSYLNSLPPDDWLFVFGPRTQTGGLSSIQQVPPEHLLELCDTLDRLEGVELKPAVRLAVLTLAHYHNQGLLDVVARIENPTVLKLITSPVAEWPSPIASRISRSVGPRSCHSSSARGDARWSLSKTRRHTRQGVPPLFLLSGLLVSAWLGGNG